MDAEARCQGFKTFANKSDASGRSRGGAGGAIEDIGHRAFWRRPVARILARNEVNSVRFPVITR